MAIPKELKADIQNFTLERYRLLKEQYGPFDVAKSFSEILNAVKENFSTHKHFRTLKDPEQSWKGILGHLLETLFQINIEEGVKEFGLCCSKPVKKSLGKNYNKIKEEISVEIGINVVQPDSDLVIYSLELAKAIAILSIKKKFRERIAQVAYWTVKLRSKGKPIKNFMVTTDEDETFSLEKKERKKKIKSRLKEEVQKAKAIAEVDTNGTFVAADFDIEETQRIKPYSKIFDELKQLKEERLKLKNESDK